MKKIALTCLLLLSATSFLSAQKKLEYYAIESYDYMMRADRSLPSDEQLIRSRDERLPIWMPENQIGWQIQDQNYFDLFFQHKEKQATLPLNFYKYLVLAIVEVDDREWSFHIQNVAFDEATQTVVVSYRARPFGPQLPGKKASAQIILIEQNRQIKNAGIRNLNFAVSVNDGALVSEKNSSLSIFPLAYTSEQYYSGDEMSGGGRITTGGNSYQKVDLAVEPQPGSTVSAPDLEAIEAEQRRQEALLAQAHARAEAEAKAREEAAEAIRRQQEEAAREKEAQLLAAALAQPDNRQEGQKFLEPQGYMVKKTIRLEPTNYLLIENIYEWDIYLKSVPPGMTPITPITAEDFLKYYAVAIIKYEKRYWEMKTTGFEVVGKEANLNYKADVTLNNMNWTATVAHIILVERGDYDTINLYENNRRVGILSVK
jgi:hypothetical protein